MAKRPLAAQTALGPMVIAATEQYVPESQRLLRDGLALRFLPAGYGLVVRACRWRVLRDLVITLSEKQAPGAWAGMLCRKRYADERVAQALDARIRQVVFLGAGLDTRAYRLVAPAGADAYELDLPANIALKRQRLQAIYGRAPGRVRLIPVDLETDDLAGALQANGFRLEQPALFVLEAVTQYLTEAGVRKTLGALAQAARGSRLLFTYVRKDFLDGAKLRGAERMYQEYVVKHRIWRFGVEPPQVAPLLRGYGWTEREQVGADEYTVRYLQPVGRRLPVMEIERFVYAKKP
jgi:methyltransferase (TIGR00027 family)